MSDDFARGGYCGDRPIFAPIHPAEYIFPAPRKPES